jgi:SPP1 family predicted phage head-tail adaptor
MTVADSITNALLRFGRPMTLRRKVWNGDQPMTQDVTVYGVTEGPLSEELVDGVSSAGEATVTFSNAQIAASNWPGPPDKLDEMIIDDGQVRTIRAVETKFLGPQVLVFVAKVLALNYDRLVRIERYAVTGTDDYGGDILGWVGLVTLPASKVDLAGTENVVAAQLGAEVTTRFRVPWSSEIADLTAADRVIYPTVNGKVYEIIAVKEMMLKAGFEIFTKTTG